MFQIQSSFRISSYVFTSLPLICLWCFKAKSNGAVRVHHVFEKNEEMIKKGGERGRERSNVSECVWTEKKEIEWENVIWIYD